MATSARPGIALSPTIERAVDLSRVDPDSREHADALSAYAEALALAGRTAEARQMVEAAVAAAHRSGSPAAISRAHGTRVALVWDTDLRAGVPGLGGLLGKRIGLG